MTRPAWMDSHLTQPQPAAWPDGVIACYLTVGGATVDIQVTFDPPQAPAPTPYEPASTLAFTATGTCNGCHASTQSGYDGYFDFPDIRKNITDLTESTSEQVRNWAQQHAEKCRAMSRPATT